MTISTTTNRKNQTANGIQTVFPYDFIVQDVTHMFVYLNDVLQVTGYTVNGVGDPAGGDVTFDVAPLDTVTVTLQRLIPLTQLVDYLPYDPFPAETHEGALDKLTGVAQQLDDTMTRSLQLPASSSAGDLTLPEPIPLNFLQWNNAGDGLNNVTLAAVGVLIVTPFSETLFDDPDADTWWDTLMATITKLTARTQLGAAGLIDDNTFSGENIFSDIVTFNAINTFNAANIFNALSTFNEKVIFNKATHQPVGTDIPSAAALPNITDSNYAHVTALAAPIIGATQANPVVITAVAHGLSNGDLVTIADVVGMVELNGNEYTVANVAANTFELSGIDGTLFTAWVSGGSIWAKILSIITTGEVGTIIKREFDGVLTLAHDAVNLILFGLDIITAAGDVVTFIEYASGDFQVINYSRGNGNPFISDNFLEPRMFPTHATGTYQIGDTDRSIFLGQNINIAKYGEAIINQGGIVNVYLATKGDSKTQSGVAVIYVNGVAVGTERTIVADILNTFQEDITVVAGDLIQVYVKASISTVSGYVDMKVLVSTASVLNVGVDPTI